MFGFLRNFLNISVELFPGVDVVSDEFKKTIAINNKLTKPRVYRKCTAYLMPDGGYTGIAHAYKRAWCRDDVLPEHVFNADDVGYVKMDEREFKDCAEGEDYVVCKICGVRKRSLTQHLRRAHGLTREEYIKKHNGGVYSREVKRAFHNCTVSKWRTQKGWDDLKQRS